MISADDQAILLVCSYIGIGHQSGIKPLSLGEWNDLARKIRNSDYGRPSGLLGRTQSELVTNLAIDDGLADRLYQLLQRGGGFAIELNRLQQLGISFVTRANPDYPERLRTRLRERAPAYLFFSGDLALAGQPGIAVVGSRNVDATGAQFAEYVGNGCARAGQVLYSGGAKGVDSLSTTAALEGRGVAVGVLAHSLGRVIREPEIRAALAAQNMCLLSPYAPDAPFSVGNAMGRNKLIYALADFAIVVASDAEKGGTWAGAIEALRGHWLPVFALEHENMPVGNKLLIEKGAIPLDINKKRDPIQLRTWLEDASKTTRLLTVPAGSLAKPSQLALFDNEAI